MPKIKSDYDSVSDIAFDDDDYDDYGDDYYRKEAVSNNNSYFQQEEEEEEKKLEPVVNYQPIGHSLTASSSSTNLPSTNHTTRN